MKIIIDWFTARNGIDFSLTKLLSTAAAITMMVQFIRTGSVDFQGFGIAVSTIVASLAAKYYVEGKDK